MTVNKMKERAFVSAVTYVRNNGKEIGGFLAKIDEYLFGRFENYEIVLVNDASTDETVSVIRSAVDQLKGSISVVNLTRKHGLEIAMLAGTDKAIGDLIYEIESPDMDYPISLIGDLYDKCIEGCDIVAGAPNKTAKLSSRIFYILLNRISYLNLDLTTETIRLVSRRALNSILNARERTRYRKALYAYSGFKKAKLFYEPTGKRKTANESTLGEKLSLAFDVIVSFSDFGFKIALILSVVFSIISILIGIYAIVVFFAMKTVVAGWTTLTLFLSAGFSGVFLIFTFLSKYVNIILLELQRRSIYTVESSPTFNKK